MMRVRAMLPMLALAAPVAVGGCAAGAGLGGSPSGGQGAGGRSEALVEIQGVDASQQTIRVRTEQGESGNVRFDGSTVVVYQQQQYPVTALERGDVVVMQLQQVSQNQLYTPRVDVRQTVQERTGQAAPAAGGLVQLSGTVGRIDPERRSFELQTEDGLFTVFLPQEAGSAAVARYESLETGAKVGVEGRRYEADGLVLTRFL